jgi:hypothetical protein
MKIHTYRSRFYAICLLVTLFTACKKQVTPEEPGNQPDVALNFFNASDVMQAASYGYAAIYVDKYINQYLQYDPNSTFPLLAPGTDYPQSLGILSYAYYNYNNGSHRLFVTDTADAVVLDTTVKVKPKSFNCLYLTDAPVTVQNQKAAYKIVSVQEDRAEIAAGKTGIRFVHLSPDAGQLSCNLIKADGSLSDLLHAQLAYGQASAYVYLDSTMASQGLYKLSINSTESNSIAITTGAPATAGRAFTIVITGFVNDQQRQVSFGKNPGGSSQYGPVTIPKSLRAIVRGSY